MASKTRKPHYPPNWKEMSQQAKERAGYRCEWCGIAHGTEVTGIKGKTYKVFMTVHHPDSDTLNPNARLICLCQRCHLRDDAPMHAKHARETLAKMRIKSALNAGQLALLEITP